QILLEEAQRFSLAEYSQACGVPAAKIVELARDFTSHGRKAMADCHGGTMHSNGFFTAYAAAMLNAMVGNLNWKGGSSAGGGKFPDFGEGPRYDLAKFPGKVKPRGVPLSRMFSYEKTTEFKEKQAQGQAYPAAGPWFPFSAAVQGEFIPAALNGYPYALKALMLWNTNPLYGQAGLYEQVKDKLADAKKLPLIVAIDPFINESSRFADYIVPDTVLYESWGATTPWAGHLTKVSSLRWPVVEPPLEKMADGQPICMETFVVALAKHLGLPGFGDKAMSDAEGRVLSLHSPEEYYLRGYANTCFAGKPVPDVKGDELALTGVERVLPQLQAVLKEEEWPKVAYALARGGRFEPAAKSYEGDWLTHRHPLPLQIYNETVGTTRNSMNGTRYPGVPTWLPPVCANGEPVEKHYPREQWPFAVVSTKSQLQSPHTIGEARLRQIQPENGIVLHPDDAAALGIRQGDRIRVTSPGGSIEGVAVLRHGIVRGAIGVEHGYGHWGLGAAAVVIDGREVAADRQRARGAAANLLGLADPSRTGISTLADMVTGANARQGTVARVNKI
ncbi:MAG: tetrathionate reductase subunit A, partial [Desulfobulbaceae bacterium A2]